jgi:hypothetical protein
MKDESIAIVTFAIARVIGDAKKLTVDCIEDRSPLPEKEAFHELLIRSVVAVSEAFQEAINKDRE